MESVLTWVSIKCQTRNTLFFLGVIFMILRLNFFQISVIILYTIYIVVSEPFCYTFCTHLSLLLIFSFYNLLNAFCSWIGNRQTSTRLWVIKCLFQNTELFCHLLIKSRDDRITHLPCCCRYNDRGKLLFLRHHNQHSNSWLNFPCCIIPYKIVYIDGCRRT